jgi:hypothetical protein
MTTREISIARKILDVLHDRDRKVIGEVLLHGEVCVRLEERIRKTEFDSVLALCDGRGWLISVKGETGCKWKLNDDGEAARISLNE